MLEIREVSRHYGDFVAVNQLNLSVAEGTIYGFLDRMVLARPPR